MIDEIHVENVALIREADLVPGAGLTVLTGETGAGKPRCSPHSSCSWGSVPTPPRFERGAKARWWRAVCLRAHMTRRASWVTRRLGADGRSRARIDGGLASVRELSERVSL